MAMFGAKPFGMPPYTDGLPGSTPQLSLDMPQMSAPQQPAPQTPDMGNGRIKPNWMGVLADALAGAAGQPGQYAQSLQHQKLFNQQSARDAQQQKARQDEWMFQQQYEAAHPKPVNNDTANDYTFYNDKLGAGSGDQYLRNQLDPIVNIPLPGGRVYVGPRSGIAAATGGGDPTSSGGPPKTLPHDFNFGGPTPSASGGFR